MTQDIKNQTVKKAALEDDTTKALRALLDDPATQSNPLYEALRKFAAKYQKLLSRLHKIVAISDSYQSQFRDLNIKFERVARTDMLTGLSSRWDLVEKMEVEKSRAERHDMVFSLILADIDYFKAINDRYGHVAGDTFLLRFGKLLKANLRREDGCARWGGEEFLVLLPETDLIAAVKVGQKLIEEVRNLVITYDGEDIRATISAGVCSYQHNQSIDECVANADLAMYAAKQAGRNRLSVFPGNTHFR
jgi:diguanylate cyclase